MLRDNRRYIWRNYQGSVIGYATTGGSMQEVYKYGPYGEPRNAYNVASWSGIRFGYTGQLKLPEARLYYYKARVYDPVMGRFMQTDPIGSADDLNLYAYVGGDPVNLNDATGNAPNKAGATNPNVIWSELKNNGSLASLSANHLQNTNRYFYTDNYGWVDVRHFGRTSSMVAEEGQSAGWVKFQGLGNEIIQAVEEFGHRDGYKSAFSPEDLPSNTAGTDFGEFLKSYKKGDVGDGFLEWVQTVGGRPTDDPRSGFERLPDTDPSVGGGANRGSNSSSTPVEKKPERKCMQTTNGYQCF